jgi:hypothetical protein
MMALIAEIRGIFPGSVSNPKNLEIMEEAERNELLLEALELVQQAQQLVDEALYGSPEEAHYRAYGRYGFDQLLGNGNPYDSSLESLLEDK